MLVSRILLTSSPREGPPHLVLEFVIWFPVASGMTVDECDLEGFWFLVFIVSFLLFYCHLVDKKTILRTFFLLKKRHLSKMQKLYFT